MTVHTLQVAEALRSMGADVHVLALGDPARGFYRATNVPFTVIPAPRSEPTLEARIAKGAELIAGTLASWNLRDHDLIHIQSVTGVAALQLRRSHGVRVARTVHHVGRAPTPLVEEWQRRSIVDVDLLIAVSEECRKTIAQSYGVEATVVHNGVDLTRFRHDPETRRERRRALGVADRFVFLTVGGLEPRKGMLDLIEAMGELKAGGLTSALLIIVGGTRPGGSDYKALVARRCAQLGLVEGLDVLFAGIVPDADLPGWYHAADAFLFASRAEGWGLVVLEAMAAGLPVVTTDLPVAREAMGDHYELRVAPGQVADFSRGMRRLVEDNPLRERLAREGMVSVGRFTWHQCARRHLALYLQSRHGFSW